MTWWARPLPPARPRFATSTRQPPYGPAQTGAKASARLRGCCHSSALSSRRRRTTAHASFSHGVGEGSGHSTTARVYLLCRAHQAIPDTPSAVSCPWVKTSPRSTRRHSSSNHLQDRGWEACNHGSLQPWKLATTALRSGTETPTPALTWCPAAGAGRLCSGGWMTAGWSDCGGCGCCGWDAACTPGAWSLGIICWKVAWYICCCGSGGTAWRGGNAGTPGGATASSGIVAADMFGTIVWQGKTKEATVVWGRLRACMGRAGELGAMGSAGFMGRLGKMTAGAKYCEGAGMGGTFAAGISERFGGRLSSPARGVSAGMTGNWGIWKKHNIT